MQFSSVHILVMVSDDCVVCSGHISTGATPSVWSLAWYSSFWCQ